VVSTLVVSVVMRLWVNVDDLSNSMFSAKMEHIYLNKIIESLCRDISGIQSFNLPKFVNTITDIGFAKSIIYANMDPKSFTYFGQTYQPGLRLEVDDFRIFGLITGSVSVSVDLKRGISATGNLDPIDLLGGLIEVHGRNRNDPATVSLKLLANPVELGIDIRGGVDLFGSWLDTEIKIDDDGIILYINCSLLHSLFTFVLDCQSQGPLKNPDDFSVYAAINNEVQDYIMEKMPAEVNKARDSIDDHLQSAIDDLKAKQDNLVGIEKTIDADRAQDQIAMGDADRKLDDAQRAVESAKSKVDNLQNSIDDYKQKLHDVHWYEVWKETEYAAAIAGLEIAKGTADLALLAAKGVLELCEKAVGTASTLDPRILAAETEHGLAEAALVAAQKFLGAIQDLNDGVAKIERFLARAIGTFFNIEVLEVDGSLARIKKGDLCSLHVKGIFCDIHFDIHVDVDLHLIDNFVSATWSELLKLQL